MKSFIFLCIFGVMLFAEGLERVKPATNELYIKECGSCHIAYQLEFLPRESWQKLMDGLKNHFGEDATFSPAKMETLRGFLEKNTASNPKLGDKIRISETGWFVKEHKNIPKRLITQKEVKSLSFCQTCHTKAEDGDYGERTLFIPNYGRYND